jgi:hypothetical protein
VCVMSVAVLAPYVFFAFFQAPHPPQPNAFGHVDLGEDGKATHAWELSDGSVGSFVDKFLPPPSRFSPPL